MRLRLPRGNAGRHGLEFHRQKPAVEDQGCRLLDVVELRRFLPKTRLRESVCRNLFVGAASAARLVVDQIAEVAGTSALLVSRLTPLLQSAAGLLGPPLPSMAPHYRGVGVCGECSCGSGVSREADARSDCRDFGRFDSTGFAAYAAPTNAAAGLLGWPVPSMARYYMCTLPRLCATHWLAGSAVFQAKEKRAPGPLFFSAIQHRSLIRPGCPRLLPRPSSTGGYGPACRLPAP